MDEISSLNFINAKPHLVSYAGTAPLSGTDSVEAWMLAAVTAVAVAAATASGACVRTI